MAPLSVQFNEVRASARHYGKALEDPARKRVRPFRRTGEHFKTGADSDGPALIRFGEPICILCLSDFHRGQRNDKPLTSLASPRFEMLSLFVVPAAVVLEAVAQDLHAASASQCTAPCLRSSITFRAPIKLGSSLRHRGQPPAGTALGPRR